MVFPLTDKETVTGVVCLRADTSSVFEMQDQSKLIFIRAMLVALLITVALGFFIARSITIPINELTEKAESMSRGDFSQKISAKSQDEIGRLADMFNLLREKLDFTLSEISNEKSKLETILKYMADGLLAIDMNRRIILANPAASVMLSLSKEDIEQKGYDQIISRYSDKLLFEEIMENCSRGGAHDTFEYGGRTFSVRYDRFKNEDDEDIGIIMLLQDITEQQKLDNMQRDFVANVSHELKTPLTTIKSYTETLLEQDINDCGTIRGFLNVVDAEADRMSRLVRELLQLSRLDYRQENWFKKETNLISVLKSAVTKIEMTAAQKEQKLVYLFNEDERLPAMIDKDGIEQVILNILSNAIKYSQVGGIIRIDARKDGKDAVISVADHGIGMSEKEIPRIFERFYRIDKARSREMGGTGLGLSIAEQIIKEHGGRITIKSEAGKGTSAAVILPMIQVRGQQNIE